MRKILLVLVGTTAMMLSVGCGKAEETVYTTSYEEAHTEAEAFRDATIEESVSKYIDTFEDLFGANFDVTKLEYDAEHNLVIYEGLAISWDNIEEWTATYYGHL